MVRWQNTVRRGLVTVAFGLLLAGPQTSLVAQQQPGAVELKRYNFSEAHLGTVVRLVFYSAEREQAKALAKRCYQRVHHLDAVFSDYRDDSELMKLCTVANQQAIPVSDELFAVLSCAQNISQQSGGMFDVTMGASTKAWRMKKQGKPDDADTAIPGHGQGSYRDLILDEASKTVRFNRPLSLDLGGIAKGYIADDLARLLKEGGITRLAVAVGGEMVIGEPPPGRKGWAIELEDPGQKTIGTLELRQTALSTSGDSYQVAEIDGKRSAHVLDPATGKGKNNQLNVTVVAPTAMHADAWATALRVIGAEKGSAIAAKEESTEAAFLSAQGKLVKTPGFPPLTPR